MKRFTTIIAVVIMAWLLPSPVRATTVAVNAIVKTAYALSAVGIQQIIMQCERNCGGTLLSLIKRRHGLW